VQVWYHIEVGRQRRPDQKRRRRDLRARITGDPGGRSVEDDLAAPASSPAELTNWRAAASWASSASGSPR